MNQVEDLEKMAPQLVLDFWFRSSLNRHDTNRDSWSYKELLLYERFFSATPWSQIYAIPWTYRQGRLFTCCVYMNPLVLSFGVVPTHFFPFGLDNFNEYARGLLGE